MGSELARGHRAVAVEGAQSGELAEREIRGRALRAHPAGEPADGVPERSGETGV